MKQPALVVMARAPLPGKAKTRLQPELTAEQCAAIGHAFIDDAVSLAVSMDQYSTFLAFTPQEAEDLFRNLVPPRMELVLQEGEDLGEIMYNLMYLILERGHSPVVLIGSDIPTLQPSVLDAALEQLDRFDLCLGPSRDGGYYLIGSKLIDRDVFSDVPWGTSHVLETTLSRAEGASLSVALLEEYYDIDTYRDLQELVPEIGKLERENGAIVPSNTKECLREWGMLG